MRWMALTLFRMGFFRDCSQMVEVKKASFHKTCHKYPAMMKLGSYTLPKEDPENI